MGFRIPIIPLVEPQAGQKITITSALQRCSSDATLLEFSDDSLLVTFESEPVFTIGNVLQLQFDTAYKGMAILSGVEVASPFSVATLTGFCWMGKKPRAERLQRAYQVNIDFLLDRSVKRTIGETIDLSKTGVRVRLRNSIPVGTAARLVLRVGSEGVLEALGRVRRIIQGSEGRNGGYDVAFSFERILQGRQNLVSVLGTDSDNSTGDEAQENRDDWFSMDQVA